MSLKRCLLVANGDRASSGAYETYLSNAGYRVETVSDAVACLNRMRQSLPDLLLLDQQIPWGGGDGVLTSLRADSRLARVPVVLVADVLPIQELSRLLVPPVIRCLEKRCPVETLRFYIDSALAVPSQKILTRAVSRTRIPAGF